MLSSRSLVTSLRVYAEACIKFILRCWNNDYSKVCHKYTVSHSRCIFLMTWSVCNVVSSSNCLNISLCFLCRINILAISVSELLCLEFSISNVNGSSLLLLSLVIVHYIGQPPWFHMVTNGVLFEFSNVSLFNLTGFK